MHYHLAMLNVWHWIQTMHKPVILFYFLVEFVLALTGATMGTLIAFVFPSTMFLHVVSEKTVARLIAKVGCYSKDMWHIIAFLACILLALFVEAYSCNIFLGRKQLFWGENLNFQNKIQCNNNSSVITVCLALLC